jgi:tripartite-type tricarboxylate transporter receptor subunit TctC
MLRRRILKLAAALAIIAPTAPLHAQNYPTRTVTLLVASSTGSSMDIVARLLSPILAPRLGQSVVVENRPGASGNIGMQQVARAAPDGHMVLVAANTLSAAPWLFKNLPYDPVADFAPVAKLAVTKFALTVHPTVEAKTVSEFIALAKKNPGRLNWATPGIATPHHLAMELLKQTVGIDVTHIPYKGSADAITDLLAGRVDVTLTPAHTIISYVRAGKLRILAFASEKRAPWFPDIPTLAEEGIAGVDSDGWAGMFLPARTPAEIVRRLSDETLAIVAQQDFREAAFKQGLVVDPTGPEGLATLLKSDLAKWRKVVAQGKISGD